MCVCVFKWLQSMQRPLFVPLLISVVCMYVFNIKFLPWKRDNRISPSYPFKHACLPSVCVFLCVSLVPHQALINCAHQVTFEKVLMGVSASEAKFPSPFSPFLPPLFSSPIYLISFYESCSSLHVISRMRHEIWPSPAARAGGGRATTASAELNVQDGVRGVWLTTDCLAVSKSFRQSGSRFLPPHPSCIGCLLPPPPNERGHPSAGVHASHASKTHGIFLGIWAEDNNHCSVSQLIHFTFWTRQMPKYFYCSELVIWVSGVINLWIVCAEKTCTHALCCFFFFLSFSPSGENFCSASSEKKSLWFNHNDPKERRNIPHSFMFEIYFICFPFCKRKVYFSKELLTG